MGKSISWFDVELISDRVPKGHNELLSAVMVSNGCGFAEAVQSSQPHDYPIGRENTGALMQGSRAIPLC